MKRTYKFKLELFGLMELADELYKLHFDLTQIDRLQLKRFGEDEFEVSVTKRAKLTGDRDE